MEEGGLGCHTYSPVCVGPAAALTEHCYYYMYVCMCACVCVSLQEYLIKLLKYLFSPFALLPLEHPDWLLLQEARKIHLQHPWLFNWRGVVIGCWIFASNQYEASLSSCTTVAPKTAG